MQHILTLTDLHPATRYQEVEKVIRRFNDETLTPVKATFYFEKETKIEMLWHLKHIQALWVRKITLKMISQPGKGTWISRLHAKKSFRSLHDFPLETVSKVVFTRLETKEMKHTQQIKQLFQRKHSNVWATLTLEELLMFLPHINPLDLTQHFTQDDLEYCEGCFELEVDFQAIWDQNHQFEIRGELGQDGVYRAWVFRESKETGERDCYLMLNPTEAIYYETIKKDER